MLLETTPSETESGWGWGTTLCGPSNQLLSSIIAPRLPLSNELFPSVEHSWEVFLVAVLFPCVSPDKISSHPSPCF